MKAIKIVFLLALAMPVMVFAQENPNGPDGGPGFRNGRGGHWRSLFGASTRPAAAEEWDAAMAFLEKNSPNRYKVLMEVNPSETSFLRAQVLKKWQNYKLITERFPDLTAVAVQRFRIEDQIFGLTLDVRSDPGRREEVAVQVHDLADKLVHLDIEEEHIRVKKLQELLAAEQTKLASSETNVDQKIDERSSRILDRMMRPQGGMRGNGGNNNNNADQPHTQATPDQLDDMASAGLILPDQIAQ